MQSSLERLDTITRKSDGWLQPDLNIVKSTWLGRLLWRIVANRFSFVRKYFYGVQLEATQSTLLNYRTKILEQRDQQLTELFNSAIKKFNLLFPKYKVDSINSKKEGEQVIDEIDLGKLMTLYQETSSKLEMTYSELEKRCETQKAGTDFSVEELEKLEIMETHYSLMERLAVVFKKHHVFPEVSVSEFEVGIRRINNFFKRPERPKQEIDGPSIINRALDRSQTPFIELINNPVYVHLPRSGLPQSYHSPLSSQSGIIDRLSRSGMFCPQDQISQLAARRAPVYTGFGISFDYCVFGKRCTLISLYKTEAQRREKAKELGLSETCSWHSNFWSFLEDPKDLIQVRKNQEWALDRFVRREMLSMLYEENYGACHIPSERDMVETYKLPLNQIANRDFIMLYHREWQVSAEETFKGIPFDEFKQAPRFKIRLPDMSLDEVREKIEELTRTQHAAYTRKDLERGTEKVPELIELSALEKALEREQNHIIQ